MHRLFKLLLNMILILSTFSIISNLVFKPCKDINKSSISWRWWFILWVDCVWWWCNHVYLEEWIIIVSVACYGVNKNWKRLGLVVTTCGAIFTVFILCWFFVVFKIIFMLIVICGCIIYRANTYGLLAEKRFENFSIQFCFLQHSKDEMGIFMKNDFHGLPTWTCS